MNYWAFASHSCTIIDCDSKLLKFDKYSNETGGWYHVFNTDYGGMTDMAIVEGLSIKAQDMDGYRFLGWYTRTSGWSRIEWPTLSDATDLITEAKTLTYANITSAGKLWGDRNVVVAKYEEIPRYTITTAVSPNSAGTATGAGTYYEGTSVSLKASASTGYVFKEWRKGNTVVSNDATYSFTVSADGAYTAVFTAVSYSVRFNANGGSGTMADLAMTYGETKSLTANGFTRTGYTFAGWNTLEGGTGEAYADGASVSNLTTTQGGVVMLYAQWNINKYRIKFDANGGVGGYESLLNYGSELSAPTVTRTGYTFREWMPGVPATVPAEEKTYTAQWNAISYTVEYYDGETKLNSVVYEYDEQVVIPSRSVSGKTFKGWNTKFDGSGTMYHVGDSVSNLSATDGAVIALYAQWDDNTYTVYFNANGGTVSPLSTTVTYGETYGTLPTPTWTGNTFDGWYTSASGGTEITSSSQVSITEDQILYAHWNAVTYTVSYMPGANGTGSPQTDTKVHGEALALKSAIFSRGGYTQTGWATSDGGTKWRDLGAAYTDDADATLYPFWEANKYTVTLDPDGGTGGVASVEATYDAALPKITTLPTLTGYDFGGFYSQKDGGGTQYYDEKGDSVSSWNTTAITTLYAKWVAHTYSVRFVYHQGKQDGHGTANFDEELAVEAPKWEGYNFIGWKATNGLEPSTALWGITSGEANAPMTANDTYGNGTNGNVYFKNLTPQQGGEVTLTAQWIEGTPETIVVMFDERGGSDVQDVSVVVGGSIILPNTVRSGWTFNGWYYENDQHVEIGIGGAGVAYSPADNITLYAKWTQNKRKVTISVVDENGQAITVSSISAVVGHSPAGTVSGMDISFNELEVVTFIPATSLTLDGVERRLLFVTSGGSVVWSNGTGANGWNAVMDSDREFTFRYSRFYRVNVGTAAGGGGTVTVSGTFEQDGAVYAYAGDTISLTASANQGYSFAGWFPAQDGGGSPIAGAGTTYNIAVHSDVYAYAKFVEVEDSNSIYEWEGGLDNKTMTWRSKTYAATKPFNPSACRVDALGYRPKRLLELTVDMFSAPDAAATATVTLDNIENQNARRLPVRRMERYMQVEVKANAEVDALLVGTSMGGLAI